jgi:PST family polysaccharide transporter
LNKEKIFVFIYSSISAVIRIATNLVAVKVMSAKLGPQGLAVIGQFSNITAIVLALCSTTLSQGLIKYLAEYNHSKQEKVKSLLSSTLKLSLLLSAFCSLALILFSKGFSNYFLFSPQYTGVFIIFGFTLTFNVLHVFFTATLNGFKEYKKVSLLNIIVSVSSLIITVSLIFIFGVFGALLSIILSQSLIFIVTFFLVRREQWFVIGNFTSKVDFDIVKKLLSYGLLGIFSAALMPLASLIIRDHIIGQYSIQDAGQFEFVNRISNVITLFFSLTISTYYIPRISEINKPDELHTEVMGTFKMIVPILGMLLVSIYFCRYIIINLLGSTKFLMSSSLFKFQLVGDFFKTCAQLLSFILVAKARIGLAIAVEIFFNAFNVTISIILIRSMGINGASMAYLVSYLTYFILFVFIYKFIILNKKYDS